MLHADQYMGKILELRVIKLDSFAKEVAQLISGLTILVVKDQNLI